MTFLNPLILLGLIASSIPVIIHLLNLRKLKKIEFSTLTFLKELQKNKIRKIKIRQILLLILRTLIIILLVLVFARPVMKGYLSGFGSHAKTSVVIILDDSFSMNLIDESGQYFKQAKTMALSILDLLEEGDDVSLIKLTDLPKPEFQSSTNYLGIKKNIDNYSPGYKHTLFSTALKIASNILSESKNYNKEIYIITDDQKSHFELNDEEKKSTYKIFDDNTRLFILDIGKKEKNNSGIVKTEIKNQIFENDKPVKIDATVKNYGDESIKDAVIGVFIDGKRVNQRNANIEKNGNISAELTVIPKNSGFIKGYTELEDDDLLQDNKSYFSLYIPPKIKLLMININPEDDLFLDLALNAANRISDTANTKNGGIFEVTETNVKSFGSYNFSNFNVVILTNPQNISESNILKIKEYADNGGGLIFFPPSPLNTELYNDLLRKLGLPLVSGTTGNLTTKDVFLAFSKIDYEHPIFYGMFKNVFGEDVTKQNNIDSPEIFYSLLFSGSTNGHNIITLSNNSPFLYENRSEKQKTLLFSVFPNLEWSDFPMKGIFLPLITRSIFYLSNNNELSGSVQVGDALAIKFNYGEPGGKELFLKDPEGSEEKIQLESSYQGYIYNFYNSNIPGIYEITDGKNTLRTISVNINPAESDLTRISKNDLNRFLKVYQLDDRYKEISAENDLSKVLEESRYGVELWKHLVLLIIILLIIEMLIARDSKKQIAELKI
jgi:hypothetical protein